MRKEFRRRHDAYVRSRNVCNEHSGVIDGIAGGQKTRESLENQTADVDRLFALQQLCLQERFTATEQCRQGRNSLRNAAKAVVNVGRLVIADDDLLQTLQLPGATSDDELVAYGNGLLERVQPHAKAFQTEGVTTNLLENLGVQVQRFVAAKNRLNSARQRYTAATESIRDTQNKTDRTIDALQAIALNAPGARPELLTKLRIARRIGPRPAEPPAQAEASPEVPAAKPTTSVA